MSPHALPWLAVVRVSGDDARTWLHGQVTNDLRELREGESRYAFALSEKGRIVSDLHVTPSGDALLVVTPCAQMSALLARFERFIIMEDVDLTPMEGLHVVSDAEGTELEAIARYEGGRLGAPSMEAIVATDVMPCDEAEFERTRIERGVPRMGVDFDERFLPQETGLTTSAVSFGKGCYLGQEAVVMLEHRGRLKRRLVRLASSAALTSGATLRDPAGTDVGRVTSASGTFAIAIVRTETIDAGLPLLADAGIEAQIAGEVRGPTGS